MSNLFFLTYKTPSLGCWATSFRFNRPIPFWSFLGLSFGLSDGYYVGYKPITLSCILFMFIEMKFFHCHSCVMFAMKSMSMCND